MIIKNKIDKNASYVNNDIFVNNIFCPLKFVSNINLKILPDSSLYAVSNLYPHLKDLENDFLEFLGYHSGFDDNAKEILQNLDDSNIKIIALVQNYFEEFSSLMRDQNRPVKLRSFYGLLKSVNFIDIACFIQLENVLSKILNYLSPNFSELPAVIIVEYSNPIDRNFTSGRNLTRGSERNYLMHFKPNCLSDDDFEILSSLLKYIGESELMLRQGDF